MEMLGIMFTQGAALGYVIVGLSCSGKRQSRAQPVIDHIITSEFYNFFKFFDFFKQCIKKLNITAKRTKISE